MSGIAGIYYLDGRPVGDEIDRMVEAMEHRGPDGIDTWSNGSVGLGHCMLHTTPESLYDEQPLVDQSGNVILTADARIDNRNKLIHSLELQTRGKKEIPDSRIILSAYERWGEECVDYLIGAFAFAIWDFRCMGFFCARDHMGIKPFYYVKEENVFAFCTEISPILENVLSKTDIDRENIKRKIGFGEPKKEKTSFRSVNRLYRANMLEVGDEGLKIKRYWRLEPDDKIHKASEEEYVEKFRRVFTEAVRCRLRSVGPVATELSGGLDSSAVTSIAWDQIKDKGNLRTFSLYFENVPETDERKYIQKLLKDKDIESVFLSGEKKGPFYYKNFHIKNTQDFFTFGNFFFSLSIYEKVSEHNINVLLDGIDGDTTVSHGLNHLKDLAYKGDLKNLRDQLLSLKNKRDNTTSEKVFSFLCPVFNEKAKEGRWLSFTRDMLFMVLSEGISLSKAIRFLLGALLRESKLFFKNIFGWSSGKSRIKNGQDKVSYSQREHLEGLDSRWLVYSLEWIDSAAAAYGLEVRHPFMDKRLVEFCLAAPGSLKLKDGFDRWIMRSGLQDLIPDSVCWRTDKASFQPVVQWIMKNAENEEFASALSENFEDFDKYLPFPADKAVDAYDRIVRGEAYPEDYTLLWYTVYLKNWLRERAEKSFSQER